MINRLSFNSTLHPLPVSIFTGNVSLSCTGEGQEGLKFLPCLFLSPCFMKALSPNGSLTMGSLLLWCIGWVACSWPQVTTRGKKSELEKITRDTNYFDQRARAGSSQSLAPTVTIRADPDNRMNSLPRRRSSGFITRSCPTSGPGMRDEPLRMSAWEATEWGKWTN